jgi:hypothetical protein
MATTIYLSQLEQAQFAFDASAAATRVRGKSIVPIAEILGAR